MNRTERTYHDVSPTVDTNAYSAKDLIGGKLTFANALSVNGYTGELHAVYIYDQAMQDQDLRLILFSEDPTGTTFTDQSSFDIADADLSKVLAVLDVTAFAAFTDNGIHPLTEITVPLFSTAQSRMLYGALVAIGTPTFAAATDVKIRLCIVQD